MRQKTWTIAVLVAGITGFLGSITTAVSEMQSLDISNFYNLKNGTYLVMLFWLVGMGITALIIWLSCRIKVKNIVNEGKKNAYKQDKNS